MFLPLELTLRPSRVCLAVLAVAHGLALLGIWLAALPLWAKLMAALMLFAGAAFLWRDNAQTPRNLRVSQSGQIQILEDEWQDVQLKGRPVVLPLFVSLSFIAESGKTRRMTLWPDSIEADLFRKLRVWLRWGRLSQA